MPAEFPSQSASGSNPHPLFWELQPEEFSVGRVVYDDNAADTALQHGGVGVKRWIIRYDGLTYAQFVIFANWVATMFYNEDQGSAYGANFRDHVPGTAYTDTSGTLYSNVHIAPGGYRIAHTKSWSWSVEFILEKRP